MAGAVLKISLGRSLAICDPRLLLTLADIMAALRGALFRRIGSPAGRRSGSW